MSTKLVAYDHLPVEIAANLLLADAKVKEACSKYAACTFADGRPSGATGFAIQIATRVCKLMGGKKPQDYTQGEAVFVTGLKMLTAERISECCDKPEMHTKRAIKDDAYATMDRHLVAYGRGFK